jgi:hypothetical protein
VMVAATKNNQVFPMTEKHHPDARVESIRLRRTMGSSLITDSYGEARYFKSQTFSTIIGVTTSQVDGCIAKHTKVIFVDTILRYF